MDLVADRGHGEGRRRNPRWIGRVADTKRGGVEGKCGPLIKRVPLGVDLHPRWELAWFRSGAWNKK